MYYSLRTAITYSKSNQNNALIFTAFPDFRGEWGGERKPTAMFDDCYDWN